MPAVWSRRPLQSGMRKIETIRVQCCLSSKASKQKNLQLFVNTQTKD